MANIFALRHLSWVCVFNDVILIELRWVLYGSICEHNNCILLEHTLCAMRRLVRCGVSKIFDLLFIEMFNEENFAWSECHIIF